MRAPATERALRPATSVLNRSDGHGRRRRHTAALCLAAALIDGVALWAAITFGAHA